MVCILFTTFILGPLVTSLPAHEYFQSKETILYLKNIIFSVRYNLPSVFDNNPYKNAVNGSLWTIPVEVFCYFGVALFGTMRLLKQKQLILLLTIVLFAFYFHFLPNQNNQILNLLPQFLINSDYFRLCLYFLVGVIYFLFQEQIIFNKILFLVATSIYLMSFKTQFFAFANFIALPYILFYIAFKIKFLERFGDKFDLSYGIYIYAFPIQQLIMNYGHQNLSVFLFFLLAYPLIILISFLSFYFIEKPCLKLKYYKFASNEKLRIQK